MEELEDETEEEPEEEDGDRFTILLFDNLFSYRSRPIYRSFTARRPATAHGPNKQRNGLQLPYYSLLVGGCWWALTDSFFDISFFFFLRSFFDMSRLCFL